MHFEIELRDIRPIKALRFSIDLDRNVPLCIVGKNGAGKTTLAKAIMNFALADTFQRTTSDGALNATSAVRYTIGKDTFEFDYDVTLRTLSTRKPVPMSLRSLVAVELPIPHGKRFSHFYTLSEADDEIRRAIILDNDTKPEALIKFLTEIYGDARFENLREVEFAKGSCCFYRVENERYVREDYFSSGEFFLVNLFRRLQSGPKLIFIDEIDISLDAAAQARLAKELRELCSKFSVNVVFTSHSLALMQTLNDGELLYLESVDKESLLTERPFAFVKSVMFGFQGWDRYILVEDEVARLVVQHFIDMYCAPTYFTYFIIEVAGAMQVVSLLQRNREHEFLAPKDAVIAILDGDQAGQNHAKESEIYCMPLWSLESAFEIAYDKPDFEPKLSEKQQPDPAARKRDKALYKAYKKARLKTHAEIIDLACRPQADEMRTFTEKIIGQFLSP